jgi:hypothetical protein
MPKAPNRLGCEALPNGQVKLSLVKNGKEEASVKIPAAHVGNAVAVLLGAAIRASKQSGQFVSAKRGASLKGVPCILPTGIGLGAGQSPEPHSIVIHAGATRVSFAIPSEQLRELGETLLAMSAREGRRLSGV